MANRISPDPLQRGARWRRSILGGLARFCRDTRGGIAIFAAIAFPVVIGGLGLGVETGYWHMTQRKLQHAADVAAHAAAVRNRAGDEYAGMKTAAQYVATTSGYLADRGTLEMNVPPSSGSHVGNADAVEVILTENWGRWFTSLYADGQVPIGARAVALIEAGAGSACVLGLAETGTAVTVSGSTEVNLSGCSVAANSSSETSFYMQGEKSDITAECIESAGDATVNSNVDSDQCIKERAVPVRDPYADVAAPNVSEVPCEMKSNFGNPSSSVTVEPTHSHSSGTADYPVNARRFCKGLDLKGQVTFAPGLYIVEGGDLTVNGGDLSAPTAAQIFGEGVTFYVVGTSRIRLNGNVELQLSAPTAGPYSGILFFGDRSSTGVNHVINGTAASYLQGAIYAPTGDIQYSGGGTGGSGGCTQIIGYTVTMTGNSSFDTNCDGTGTDTIVTNEPVRIVE